MPDPTTLSFRCPECGAVSYHPEDIRQGYCGRCHKWTRLEAEVRAELVGVAGLLFELATATAELAELPVAEMPTAMKSLAADLDAVIAKLAGGEDR